uniref:Uncharacterized protein n=2 Tax=Amorphochlora amoebiformis TaxID=1561963 RepID=A0A7S0CW42_9EUKA|mmetsp:Transcript_14381/g.22827  ORF Transcript_14381/g.22827 Transcript_14381/m.22827 type:complete len:353 (+) Transcript_14381:51-1109(+)
MTTLPVTEFALGASALKSSHNLSRTQISITSKHAPREPVNGDLIQINSLDQFHESFKILIKEFKFPSAACGAFSVANSIILHSLLTKHPMNKFGVLTKGELESITQSLRTEKLVIDEVRKIMSFVHDTRQEYLKKHESKFPENEKDRYQRDWVANYEISDYLIKNAKDDAKEEKGEKKACYMCNKPRVHFLRYNQWPERDGAKHEEKERLIEEKPFGGIKTGDKATVSLEEEAARFIVESFTPKRKLYRPEEWSERYLRSARMEFKEDEVEARLFQIFVLDVNGHFTCGFSCLLSKDPQKPPVPTLVTINTTSASYLDNSCVAAAFDLSFRPPPKQRLVRVANTLPSSPKTP